jgi:glycosyltransferase involved in cell wall biosynthesis
LSLKVTIVLPTHNGAKYLRQSIDSCLNQTYSNLELIIVDDGSTDETPSLIKSYNDKRIKFLRHKKNVGLPRALNSGFRYASGDFLTWTSDDNQYLPTAIEEMISFLAKNKGFGFVYADYISFNLQTGHKELRKLPDIPNIRVQNDIGACFLFTRQVWREVGEYNPNYSLVEDYDYWIRVWQRFKVKHYPRVLYIYGEHPKSLTNTKRVGVVLFESALKFNYKFISLRVLMGNIAYITKELSSIKPPKTIFKTVKSNLRIFQVEKSVGVLFLFFLTFAFVLRLCRLLIGRFNLRLK